MRLNVVLGLGVSGFVASAGMAQTPVRAFVEIKIGDTLGSSTVSSLNDPYVNSLGQYGAVVGLADTTRSIVINGASVFNSSSDTLAVGGEGTMGISDAGGFIYSPTYNGEDAVYTNNGLLLRGTEPAPGMPGMNSVFNSRPRMNAAGTAFWVGGVGPATTTTTRVFYTNPTPANPSASTPLIVGGGTYAGVTITAAGVEFGYDISDNGQYINRLTATGTAATAPFVALNGTTLIARAGQPTGQGDNWQNFSHYGVNNGGNHVISGDTDGVAATDAFIAYNGAIGVREGATLGGRVLGGSINALSINNNNDVAFIWSLATPTGEGLFRAENGGVGTAQLIAQTGDLLDTDGDGAADWTLADFNASGAIAPGLDLPDSGDIFVNVDLTPIGGGTNVEAIISFRIGGPVGCDSIDFNGDGLFPDNTDLEDFLSVFGGGPCSTGTCGDIDFNNDGL
ncbi:MAG TPA: hypothetical protein VD971_09200, partial [Phycisphaerales bacterium]|nr:hypothetical protein [Phycisphaerales bacterium]